MSDVRIVDMDAGNMFDYGFCGTKNPQHEGFRRKAEWFKNRQKEGMRYEALYSEEKGTVGMIEYIPGEYAWRGVEAEGYMVIHCLCIFDKRVRGQGVASRMIEECMKDAKKENKHGVAVVTRKGAWMVGKDVFLKNGFEVIDIAEPDFELLVKKLKRDAPSPKFKENGEKALAKYQKGLTIFWSDQCPYIAKSIHEIRDTIKERYGIKANIVEIKDHKQAQDAPSPYAIFSLIYDGELLAFHPISNKRFMNIMDKVLGR
jgi:N-acetylglutamate synthase-like GNAT family acetyltransferase